MPTVVIEHGEKSFNISHNLKNTLSGFDRLYLESWSKESPGTVEIAYVRNDNEEVMSFALLHKIEHDPYGKHKEPYLMDFIYTQPVHRRSGYASDLLSKLDDLGYQITAICNSMDSRDFFIAHGYQYVDTVMSCFIVMNHVVQY